MVACFRPSLSWTRVIELAFTNHDKTLAVKAATSIVIVEHSSNDLEIFIDHTFTASISPFLALRKLIKFLYFSS